VQPLGIGTARRQTALADARRRRPMSFTFVDLFAVTLMDRIPAESFEGEPVRERLKDKMKPGWEPDLG